MRISSLWAALALACIIIVATAGASFAHAGFTSMFTLALPEHGYAQASPLKSGEFVWKALDVATRSTGTTDPGMANAMAVRNSFGSGSISLPAVSSTSNWMNTVLTPGIDQKNNPVQSSYDNFLQRYMNGTGNIFTS